MHSPWLSLHVPSVLKMFRVWVQTHWYTFCMLERGCLSSCVKCLRTPQSSTIWVWWSLPVTMLPVARSAGVWGKGEEKESKQVEEEVGKGKGTLNRETCVCTRKWLWILCQSTYHTGNFIATKKFHKSRYHSCIDHCLDSLCASIRKVRQSPARVTHHLKETKFTVVAANHVSTIIL